MKHDEAGQQLARLVVFHEHGRRNVR